MKKYSVAWIFFILSLLLFFLIRVDLNTFINPKEFLYAFAFGYVVANICYNMEGFFTHHLRKITDEHYRERSRKYGLDRKYPFLIFPVKEKEQKKS